MKKAAETFSRRKNSPSKKSVLPDLCQKKESERGGNFAVTHFFLAAFFAFFGAFLATSITSGF